MYARKKNFARAPPLNNGVDVVRSATYCALPQCNNEGRDLWTTGLLDVVVREQREQARPVEARAGVALAAGGDIAVRSDVAQREACSQMGNQRGETRVLRTGEAPLVGAFELHTDGEVV